MNILTLEDATAQATELVRHYPNLSVLDVNNHCIRLQGDIEIYRTAAGFTLDHSYKIEVRVPVDSTDLPVVIDLNGYIDSSYPHRYRSGELCLETDAIIRFRFINGFNLIEWFDEYVETYFFSYEYFKRYGTFPFGERPHGLEGVMSTYQDLFHEQDLNTVAALLRYAADEKYRGHIDCPCGSGQKLRRCHGQALFPLMSDPRKKEVVRMDVKGIRKAITAYESTRNNMLSPK